MIIISLIINFILSHKDSKAELHSLLERTRGGSIKKEIDASSQRQIGRVETNLQLSKIKLSVARNENSVLKKKVDSLRKDKLLQINILSDMVRQKFLKTKL